MPRYRGTIYKSTQNGQVKWQNVYTIDALDGFNSMEVLLNVKNAEVAVHYNTVFFYRAHTVNIANKADVRTSSLVEFGALDPAGLGGPLPLFNTVRVVFGDNIRRPESKYLRIPGNEANLTNGAWDGEFIDFIQTNYADVVMGIAGVVGPSGEAFTTASVQAAVQMRQLGWHRRSRPGFKRGWVPV